MTTIDKFLDKVICGDALQVLSELPSNSIDIVLTDPPYFLDKLDNGWDIKKVHNKNNQQVVTSLPAGMKFDTEQGKNFYRWYFSVSTEIFRILKPGGFFFSFSSPRLYHRMCSAIDDAGFEIRDSFIWLYTQNQPKAMSLNHFIDRLEIPENEKLQLKEKLKGWKTPQLKSCFEPIAMGQKPTDGTYLNNILKNKVGLFNTNVTIGKNMFPSNVLSIDPMGEIIDHVFLLPKPTIEERGNANNHLTVKPLVICEYIIKLAAFSPDAIILDPFLGSGTTAVAAKGLGFHYIGIDINKEYVNLSEKRLAELDKKAYLFPVDRY